MKQDMIIVLDLGGADIANIARKIRALGVYSEIHEHNITKAALDKLPNIKGIILNGTNGENGELKTFDTSEAVYNYGVPLMAIGHKYGLCKRLVSSPSEESAFETELSNFIFSDCKAEKNWNIESFISDQIELIKRQVGNKKVLLALSGGVDSSVVAALLIKAIGSQLTCVHVNHGFLRKGEPEQVIEVFKRRLGANLIYIDAAERFLSKLENISDPEEKRRIIGTEFIRIFEEEAKKLEGIEFLAQGTIYPDIIESGTLTTAAIKAHHNVGGLPEDLKFELVEPLKMLFKDEVRSCGKSLGLPDDMVYRQPFPGPGLAVRCPGAITRDRLEAVRESDAIVRDEFNKAGLGGKVFQYFTVVPDVKSTGIKNGKRCFEYAAVIRAVNTIDAMTAEIEQIKYEILEKITKRITSEVEGINRVLYDLTPKPTGTIEWE